MTPHEITHKHDRTYTEMLAVYNEHKRNAKHVKFFNGFKEGKPSDLHFKMLENELKNIARIHHQNGIVFSSKHEDVQKSLVITKPIIVAEIKHAKTERPKIDSNPVVRYEDLSDEMKSKFDDNGKFTAEIKSFHAIMKALPSDKKNDAKRKELAEKICILEDKRASNWNDIDTWYKSKDLPAPKKEENKKPTIEELSKKIEAATRYLERYATSKKPKQIAKCKEYRKYLKECGISSKK